MDFLNSKFLNPDYLFAQMVSFFSSIFKFFSSWNTDTFKQIQSIYHDIVFVICFFFITLLCYCAVRMYEIRKKEHAYLHHEIAEYAHHHAAKERAAQEREGVSKNPRWIQVLDYLFSDSEGEWKLAIIEADSMLDELLTQLGFVGETLGDKLKSATQENFRTLTSAWEVHTIRNRIAHEGVNFPMTQREAKRVIALYEGIFREFGFI